MKYYLFLSSLLMLVHLSCNHHNDRLTVQQLKKERSINQLSDSSFFSDIRSVDAYKEKFFLSDYNRDNIMILDHNLELDTILGTKGRGPGELLGASRLYVYQDSIFIINDGKRAIEIFSFNNYLSTVNIPQTLSLSSDIRFCVNKGKIILTNFNSVTSMSMLSLDSDSVKDFGYYKEYGTTKETRIKNKRHIQIMNDNIVALSDCQPLMELYNMNGELINIYEFQDIEIVDSFMRFTEMQEKSENSYYQIFQDMFVLDNQVYILALSIENDNKIQCNKIIHLEMIDNFITPKQIFSLGKGWFGPFCVIGEKILVFDKTNMELALFGYN